MTPEQRAQKCWDDMPDGIRYDDGQPVAIRRIADAIRQATAAEREACAVLAESLDDGSYDCSTPRDVASAIRERTI